MKFWYYIRQFLIVVFRNKRRCHLRGNRIHGHHLYFRKTAILFNKTKNNVLQLNENMIIECTIEFTGNNNHLIIHNGTILKKVKIFFNGDNNVIEIGANSTIASNTEISVFGGKKIIIGDGFMCSSNVTIMSGDGHKIFYPDTSFNKSEDIVIGKHVWACKSSFIFKGVTLGNGIVVGANAVVNHSFLENNVILAGIPATIVKHNILWER